MDYNLNQTRTADPVTASVIGSGINLVGNMIGTNYANDKNIELQESINRRNYQLAMMQNAYNKYMVDYANEYENPKNQIARRVDAGWSPYSAAGSVASQNSNILQSAPMANQSAPQVFAPDLGKVGELVGNNLINAYNAETNRYLADIQDKAVEKDMSYKDRLMSNLDKQEDLIKKQGEQLEAYAAHLRELKNTQIEITHYKQTENRIYDEFGKKTAEAEVNKLVSEYDLNKSNEKLIRNQIYFNSEMLKFQLLSAIRDATRVTNESMAVINTLKLGDSLVRLQNSVTKLNTFDLNNMKPLELQLLQNTVRYDAAHKFFGITRDFIGTFNLGMDFLHDPIGAGRAAKDLINFFK